MSYDELVGLCVTFTFPESSAENYVVSLTYFDVDEDTITIASSEELVDAVEQYAEKRVLRLTTEVKPKDVPAATTRPSAASSTERGTSTSEEAPLANPQVKNVLESFVGILSTAVSHLQEGLAAPERAASAKARAAAATVTVSREEPAANRSGAAADPSGDDSKPATSQKSSCNEAEEEADEEQTPFIHGRHTCDSCLTTPIVGKRFHAKSLPDYDLCENCHSSYTGKEVQFEAVELDRDRAFQLRWMRRREKIQRFEAKRADMANRAGHCFGKGPPGRFAKLGADPTGRRCGGPPCPPPGPPPHHGPPGPPPPGPPPPHPPHHDCPPGPHPPHLHPHHGPHHHGPHHGPPPFAPPHGPPHWAHIGHHGRGWGGSPPSCSSSSDRTSEFDTALKEAIRRSLRDIAPKEAELLGESKPCAPEASRCSEESAPKADEGKDTEGSKVDVAMDEQEINVDPESTPDSGLNDEETKAMEDAMETASVDSEKLLLEEDDQKPAASPINRTKSTHTDTSKDESFHSEAVGSGDVAEAVGATLDLVAGMISDMLSEADGNVEDAAPAEKKQKKDDTTNEETAGDLIVEQVPSKFDGAADENEWHVVGDSSEDGSVKDDGDIGRAAEMLGSALFNSDMKSSGEHESHGNVSNLSDSFSVPSSVPSIAVGPTQRAHWSVQLSKLQELGFDNEAQCVEILERLQAANIGVESDDDVSVTRVVNAILEQD